MEALSPVATPIAAQKSPWHSPVPYLFGGLAAMLGLIAFALLILACSYWKLSGYLEGRGGENEGDLEAGEGNGGDGSSEGGLKAATPVFEEKILVIMAGQEKPTFLATPMSSRASSFSSKSSCISCSTSSSENSEKLEGENDEEKREVTSGSSSAGGGGGDGYGGGQVELGSVVDHGRADQVP